MCTCIRCLCLSLILLFFISVAVVPNSLLVVPDAVNRVIPEGESFRLLCNVSHDFTEGIYLSFTWSVIKGSSVSQDLLTVGPGVGVTVGNGFTQRYADGAMRLELGNEASHSVVLSGAMPDDQGMYTCTARLWTREQGVWKRIQEKTVEMGDVTVTPAGQCERNFTTVELIQCESYKHDYYKKLQ